MDVVARICNFNTAAHRELNEFFQTHESIEIHCVCLHAIEFCMACIATTYRLKTKRENKRGYWITTCAALESISAIHFQWHGHSDLSRIHQRIVIKRLHLAERCAYEPAEQ